MVRSPTITAITVCLLSFSRARILCTSSIGIIVYDHGNAAKNACPRQHESALLISYSPYNPTACMFQLLQDTLSTVVTPCAPLTRYVYSPQACALSANLSMHPSSVKRSPIECTSPLDPLHFLIKTIPQGQA